jgi:hypothetical protein
MPCSEYRRLQQHYEAAFRSWAQLMASSQLLGQPMYLTMKVRQRALDNKEAAKNILNIHEQDCSICRRKPMTGFPPAGVA